MFLKAQLQWNVIVPSEKLHKGLALQKAIIVCLLEMFAATKTTSALGYLLAIITLDKLGEGKVRQDSSGDVLFPVTFTCMTFKIFKGEVLDCEVHKILNVGILLRCGPVKEIFLYHTMMRGYSFVSGDNPMFVSNKSEKIEKGVKVRVMIAGVQYMEAEKEFKALANLNGDFLGPK